MARGGPGARSAVYPLGQAFFEPRRLDRGAHPSATPTSRSPGSRRASAASRPRARGSGPALPPTETTAGRSRGKWRKAPRPRAAGSPRGGITPVRGAARGHLPDRALHGEQHAELARMGGRRRRRSGPSACSRVRRPRRAAARSSRPATRGRSTGAVRMPSAVSGRQWPAESPAKKDPVLDCPRAAGGGSSCPGSRSPAGRDHGRAATVGSLTWLARARRSRPRPGSSSPAGKLHEVARANRSPASIHSSELPARSPAGAPPGPANRRAVRRLDRARRWTAPGASRGAVPRFRGGAQLAAVGLNRVSPSVP